MTYLRKEKPKLKYDFVMIDKKDIGKFKNKSKMCFCFDDDDRMGLAYYDSDRLIGLAGASQSGKYLWGILGYRLVLVSVCELWKFLVMFEKFSFDEKYRGLGTEILVALSQIIKEENKDVSPFTSTQFSHTRSINTAIRTGFEMNLCITGKKSK